MLIVDTIHAGYGEIEVLHGVSLTVETGEIVALIGANGAGKTTLLKTLSGLIKARTGKVIFAGQETQKLPAHKIVERGLIHAPEGRALLVRMSVEENMLMGAYRRNDGEVGDDVARMYERFPVLKERHDQPADVLSGGEQQMLAIARALMARPKLLLLDEPSLGLAPKIVVEIFKIIKSLRDDGMTILLVEQNARSALQFADRGYVMERGTIPIEGKGAELLENPDVQRTYLGKQRDSRQTKQSGEAQVSA